MMLNLISMLGALFCSKRFQNNETELVVFVTPITMDKNTLALEESMAKTALRLKATPWTPEPDLASVLGLVKPSPTPIWDESPN